MFSEAAPAGSRLLARPSVTISGHGWMKSWATVCPNGTIRVTVINKDMAVTGPARVVLPGRGPARLQTLKSEAGSIIDTVDVSNGIVE